MGRGVVVAETRGAALHLLLRARELRDRAGIVTQGQEEQCSLRSTMLGQLFRLQQQVLIGREGTVRQMLEAGARRAEVYFLEY